MKPIPRLQLTKLSTGGGWGLGEQYARLPAYENQLNNPVTIFTVTKGSERLHESDQEVNSEEEEELLEETLSRGHGGETKRRPEDGSEAGVGDEDDQTFVDFDNFQDGPGKLGMSVRGGTPRAVVTGKRAGTSVQSGQGTQNSEESLANVSPSPGATGGWIVSDMDLPPSMEISSLLIDDEDMLWATVGGDPLFRYKLIESGDLSSNGAVSAVSNVSCITMVKLYASAQEEGKKASEVLSGFGGVDKRNTDSRPTGVGADVCEGMKDGRSEVKNIAIWCGHSNSDAISVVDLTTLHARSDDLGDAAVSKIEAAHAGGVSFIYTAPYCVRLPNGELSTRVWTSGRDRLLKVWDGRTRRPVMRKQLEEPVVECCAVPPAVNASVWTVSLEATVRIWDYDGRPCSNSRFVLNTNALKFKSSVRTLRYHVSTNIMWVCLRGSSSRGGAGQGGGGNTPQSGGGGMGGITLVAAKDYVVTQSLSITALALEFVPQNTHTAVIVGYYNPSCRIGGGAPDEGPPSILLLDMPISSGRVGVDAGFNLTREIIRIGCRLDGVPTGASPWPGIRLFGNSPNGVIAHMNRARGIQHLAVFCTEGDTQATGAASAPGGTVAARGGRRSNASFQPSMQVSSGAGAAGGVGAPGASAINRPMQLPTLRFNDMWNDGGTTESAAFLRSIVNESASGECKASARSRGVQRDGSVSSSRMLRGPTARSRGAVKPGTPVRALPSPVAADISLVRALHDLSAIRTDLRRWTTAAEGSQDLTILTRYAEKAKQELTASHLNWFTDAALEQARADAQLDVVTPDGRSLAGILSFLTKEFKAVTEERDRLRKLLFEEREARIRGRVGQDELLQRDTRSLDTRVASLILTDLRRLIEVSSLDSSPQALVRDGKALGDVATRASELLAQVCAEQCRHIADLVHRIQEREILLNVCRGGLRQLCAASKMGCDTVIYDFRTGLLDGETEGDECVEKLSLQRRVPLGTSTPTERRGVDSKELRSLLDDLQNIKNDVCKVEELATAPVSHAVTGEIHNERGMYCRGFSSTSSLLLRLSAAVRQLSASLAEEQASKAKIVFQNFGSNHVTQPLGSSTSKDGQDTNSGDVFARETVLSPRNMVVTPPGPLVWRLESARASINAVITGATFSSFYRCCSKYVSAISGLGGTSSEALEGPRGAAWVTQEIGLSSLMVFDDVDFAMCMSEVCAWDGIEAATAVYSTEGSVSSQKLTCNEIHAPVCQAETTRRVMALQFLLAFCIMKQVSLRALFGGGESHNTGVSSTAVPCGDGKGHPTQAMVLKILPVLPSGSLPQCTSSPQLSISATRSPASRVVPNAGGRKSSTTHTGFRMFTAGLLRLSWEVCSTALNVEMGGSSVESSDSAEMANRVLQQLAAALNYVGCIPGLLMWSHLSMRFMCDALVCVTLALQAVEEAGAPLSKSVVPPSQHVDPVTGVGSASASDGTSFTGPAVVTAVQLTAVRERLVKWSQGLVRLEREDLQPLKKALKTVLLRRGGREEPKDRFTFFERINAAEGLPRSTAIMTTKLNALSDFLAQYFGLVEQSAIQGSANAPLLTLTLQPPSKDDLHETSAPAPVVEGRMRTKKTPSTELAVSVDNLLEEVEELILKVGTMRKLINRFELGLIAVLATGKGPFDEQSPGPVTVPRTFVIPEIEKFTLALLEGRVASVADSV